MVWHELQHGSWCPYILPRAQACCWSRCFPSALWLQRSSTDAHICEKAKAGALQAPALCVDMRRFSHDCILACVCNVADPFAAGRERCLQLLCSSCSHTMRVLSVPDVAPLVNACAIDSSWHAVSQLWPASNYMLPCTPAHLRHHTSRQAPQPLD